MRRLMLLRHAKSAWPDGMGDIDRPLAKRGQEAAPRMAAYLADEQLFPDLVLVSPARRTRETWNLVRAKLGDVPVRSEPRIYEAPAERLLAIVREVEDEVRTLMMIGHNPGFEDMARLLGSHGDRYAFARMTEKFPTAALAVLDFAVEHWRDAAPRSARLERFITPNTLGQDEGD